VVKVLDENCDACGGFGFLLMFSTERDQLEVQRCDTCKDTVYDEDASAAVVLLAREALKAVDCLARLYDRNDPNGDYYNLFRLAERWVNGETEEFLAEAVR